MQSTLRDPAVTNMRKALNLQFTVGLVFYYGVSIVGYWAYGSTVSEYLPQELSGPKSVKVLINATVFLQSVVSQHVSHSNCTLAFSFLKFFFKSSLYDLLNFQFLRQKQMFVAPIHEFLDTKFLKLDKSMNSKGNLKRRLYVRALLFAVNTFVTAAFPFMGDFVNLFGSFTLVPLTFVFPSMIFIKVISLYLTIFRTKLKIVKLVIYLAFCSHR